MKRWLGGVRKLLTYSVVSWTICGIVSAWVASVRTQLKYGYAVDRAGQQYNIWTLPAILLALAAAAGVWLLIQEYRDRSVRTAGQGLSQGITYPVAKRGRRKLARKRRRKN